MDDNHFSSNRRHFIKSTAALLGTSLAGTIHAGHSNKPKTKIFMFSKHLQWLDYPAMAETAAELGLTGLDLTVRPGGHVLPERVKDDLPRAVEAMRAAGLEINMMTTRINNPDDPHTVPILETAARLGFHYYRMAYFRYDSKKPIPAQLDQLKPVCRDLAALNRQYQLHGVYQNHAGSRYVGATIWDLWTLLQGIDPQDLGCQFDIRHTVVEGGQSWPTLFRLIARHVTSLVAKDFYWHKSEKGWRALNCPLGEGMVDFPAYLEQVKQSGVTGPVSLHLEHDLGGAEHGHRQLKITKTEVLKRMRQDISVLHRLLADAGL